MKVMMLLPKFNCGLPEQGGPPSDAELAFRDTLIDTNLCNEGILEFQYDEAVRSSGYFFNDLLLETVSKYRPDVIFYNPLGWPNMDFSRMTFDTIRRCLDAKIIMLRTDASGPEGHLFNESWMPFVDHIVFLDASLTVLGYKDNPKAIQGFVPYNSRFFYDRRLPKDIDVSFSGNINKAPDRMECINFLKANGINVVISEKKMGWDEYAPFINRSKISLNFCHGFITGRPFEVIASRSMLLEDFGSASETAKLFDNGKEFVSVNSKEEMLEKIRYYLSNDAEREKITQAGYDKAVGLYNAYNMYSYVFNRAGFPTHRYSNYYEFVYKMESM